MKTFSTLNHLVPACLLALTALGAAPPSTAATANALPGLAETPTVVAQVQAQAGRYGPYATRRRANEVAAWFRQQGFSAVAFHSGDGFYVDVS